MIPTVVWVIFAGLCFAAGTFGFVVGRWAERSSHPPQQSAEVALRVTAGVAQLQSLQQDLKVMVDDLRDMQPTLTDLGPRMSALITAVIGDTVTGELPDNLRSLYQQGEGFQTSTFEDEVGRRHRSPPLAEPRSGHLTLLDGREVPAGTQPTGLSRMRRELAERAEAELPHLRLSDCPSWIDGCHCDNPAALPPGLLPWGHG